MSDLTSIITEITPLTSVISGGTPINVSTFSEGGRTLSELTDIDLQGVVDGSILVYDTNEFVSRTLSGDATINSDGVLTLNPNSVTLGTDTSGAYISTVTGTSDQITVLGSGGETANITLSLPQSIAISSSPTFNNITLSGVINNTDLTSKLALKAPLDSPVFSGTVSGITKGMVGLSAVDNTSDFDKPLSNASIGALANKVDVIAGKELSDENYTLEEKNKLSSVEAGAEVNVNADWSATTGDARILNKPPLGSAAASNISDFASAAQGVKADSALQPLPVVYLGDYNNGVDYTYNDVVKWPVDGQLYKRIGEPNPGYPPGTSYWELFEPQTGSPGYDLWVSTILDTKVDVIAGKGLSDSNYTATEKTKLAGIADGATSNSTDAHLLDRTNHTGSQSYTTITGLGTLATQSGTFSGSSSGVNTGDQTITLGGDASGSGTGTINVTLASTGVSPGSIGGSATSTQGFVVDSKGRITSVQTPITITPNFSSITNKPTTLSGYGVTDGVDISGTQTISGEKTFSLSPHVPLEPTAAGHAASKAYVDSVAEGLHVHESVHVLTQTPLATLIGGGAVISYSNGVDGVGATLVSSVSANWATLLTDPDLTTGSRLIVAGQANTAHNGIYEISSSTTLTRASDFDTPTEMAGGDFVFVTHGQYADTGWVLSEAVDSVGVSPVLFVQFSGAGAYEAGSGLLRDGTTFSVVAGSGISVDGSVSLSTVGSPGTYRSVTVDTYGRVTSGSNPTTLSGYGITDAASSTALSNHISDATVHLTSTQNTLLDGITVTSDKINYLSSVSSNIQTQLDGKSATDHNHSNATTSVAGFLSPTDKTKLDNIPDGVNYGIVTNAFPSGFGSGIASINWQAGTYWSGSLGLVGGTQIQFQNVVAGKIITLSITGSGYAVSWPSGITWLGDSPPSLSVGGQTKIIRILATSTSTFVATVDTKLSSTANYSDLVNVPTSFTPAVHSHDVVGTQSFTAGFMSYSDKVKLDGIASGAEVNVNADWTATSGDAQILNKPTTLSGYGISDAVNISGSQTITGEKTFSLSPHVPLTPTIDTHTASKGYVDTQYTGISATVGSTATGDPGTSAIVTNTGTSKAVVLNFTIPRGDVGATGTAATIAVGSVVTGIAGSDVTITNSGSSSAAIFDFSIPKGDKGDTGEAGEVGPIGPSIESLIITETTTARTLALSDTNQYIRCTNVSQTFITVPPESVVAWTAGAVVYFRRTSTAGAINLTAGAGVTINNGSLTPTILADQNFAIKKVDTNVWDLI